MPRRNDDSHGTTVAITSLCAVVLVATLALLPWWLLDQPVDALPAWIESVATAAAFLAAAIAATFAAAAFRLERQREARWEDGQRKAQAENVAVWFVARRVVNQTACMLQNATPLPIYDVAVTLVLPGPEPGAAGMSLGAEYPMAHLQVVPPSREETLAVRLEPELRSTLLAWHTESQTWRYQQNPGVKVDFTDAAGARWRRNVTGILEEVHGYRDC